MMIIIFEYDSNKANSQVKRVVYLSLQQTIACDPRCHTTDYIHLHICTVCAVCCVLCIVYTMTKPHKMRQQFQESMSFCFVCSCYYITIISFPLRGMMCTIRQSSLSHSRTVSCLLETVSFVFVAFCAHVLQFFFFASCMHFESHTLSNNHKRNIRFSQAKLMQTN